MATHSSALAWKISWTEEPGRYSSWGCKESDTTEQLHFLSSFKLSWTFMFLHGAVFSAWMPPFGGLIIEGLQQKNSSGASARTCLSGKEELLQDSFLHSDSILRTLSLLSFSSCPQVSGSIKLQEPHVHTDPLVSVGAFPWRSMDQERCLWALGPD